MTPRWVNDERGIALITILVITLITTGIGIALVGIMNTDVTHAGTQHAKTRSLEAARAGLEAAKDAVINAANPIAFSTSTSGVSGSQCPPTGVCSQFQYWVDTAHPGWPASQCGSGVKTLDAEGAVAYLAFTIRSWVRACGVPGPAFPTALFGVNLIESQGATSRTYIAPFTVGLPGSPPGGNVGSFTEINFGDPGLRINAVSESCASDPSPCSTPDTVTVRNPNPSGSPTITIPDYQLYGFTSDPTYETNPSLEALPWPLIAFGDIVKGQPTSGPLPNSCIPPTPFACLTVQMGSSDVGSMYELRHDQNMRHSYMNRISRQILPRLCDPALLPSQRIGCLNPDDFRIAAAGNTQNSAINAAAGLSGKLDSAYTPTEFDQIVNYLAANPPQMLRGVVYIDGSYQFRTTVSLGGSTSDVTLVVRGDLIMDTNVSLTNRHDVFNSNQATAVAARQLPGILIFGLAVPLNGMQPNVCMGERPNGSGRLIMCGGSNQMFITDGLLLTADGAFIGSRARVDLIGGLYNDNRGTSNPSFTNNNSTVVVRFDPLAFSFIPGAGIYIVSWQQLR